MSFYGKVINYLTKAFSKIKVNEIDLNATHYEDQLEIHSDNWISLKPDINNLSINIEHSNAQTQRDTQPCSVFVGNIDSNVENVIESEGDITDGAELIISLPTFDEKGHQTNVQLYRLKLLTNKLKQDILGDGDIAEAFDTLQEIAAWIQKEGVDATELITEITKIQNQLQDYATITSVAEKVQDAIIYAEKLISDLDVARSGIPNRYISDIEQIDGKIAPIYTDLPFDYPEAINLEYNEETGDLSFPSYFRTYATGEAPAVVYVYDGGEI